MEPGDQYFSSLFVVGRADLVVVVVIVVVVVVVVVVFFFFFCSFSVIFANKEQFLKLVLCSSSEKWGSPCASFFSNHQVQKPMK